MRGCQELNAYTHPNSHSKVGVAAYCRSYTQSKRFSTASIGIKRSCSLTMSSSSPFQPHWHPVAAGPERLRARILEALRNSAILSSLRVNFVFVLATSTVSASGVGVYLTGCVGIKLLSEEGSPWD